MTVSALAGVFLGVLLGGVAATWVLPNTAYAVLDPDGGDECTGHYYNQMRTANQHYGTEVANPGMLYINHTPSLGCTHTSSILAKNGSNYVEVGWIDAAGGITVNGCHDESGNLTVGDGNPKKFRAYHKANVYDCTTFGDIPAPPNPPAYNRFEVLDQDGDQTWNFLMDGSSLGASVPMPFSLSYPLTNGERYGAGEFEDATFDGLYYMPLNGSWTPWGSYTCVHHDSGDPYDSVIRTVTASFLWIDVSTTGLPAC